MDLKALIISIDYLKHIVMVEKIIEMVVGGFDRLENYPYKYSGFKLRISNPSKHHVSISFVFFMSLMFDFHLFFSV